MRYLLNFRTLPNGGFTYIRSGMTRGYWRILLVQDPAGSRHANSANVLRIVRKSAEGIRGVTARSAYYIGGARQSMLEEVERLNAQLSAEGPRIQETAQHG